MFWALWLLQLVCIFYKWLVVRSYSLCTHICMDINGDRRSAWFYYATKVICEIDSHHLILPCNAELDRVPYCAYIAHVISTVGFFGRVTLVCVKSKVFFFTNLQRYGQLQAGRSRGL